MVDMTAIQRFLDEMDDPFTMDVAPQRTRTIAALVNELKRLQPVLEAALAVEHQDYMNAINSPRKMSETTAVQNMVKVIRRAYGLRAPSFDRGN